MMDNLNIVKKIMIPFVYGLLYCIWVNVAANFSWQPPPNESWRLVYSYESHLFNFPKVYNS